MLHPNLKQSVAISEITHFMVISWTNCLDHISLSFPQFRLLSENFCTYKFVFAGSYSGMLVV